MLTDPVSGWTHDDLNTWFDSNGSPFLELEGPYAAELSPELRRALEVNRTDGFDQGHQGFGRWRSLSLEMKAEYRRQVEAGAMTADMGRRAWGARYELLRFVAIAGGLAVVVAFLFWSFANDPDLGAATDPDEPDAGLEQSLDPPDVVPDTDPVIPNGFDAIGDNKPTGSGFESGGEGADIVAGGYRTGSHVFTMTVLGDGRAMSAASTTKWYLVDFKVNNDPATNFYDHPSAFYVTARFAGGTPNAVVYDTEDVEVADATTTAVWLDESTLQVTVSGVREDVVVTRMHIELTARTQDADGNTVATFGDDLLWTAET